MTGPHFAAEANQSPSHRHCHLRIVHNACLIYPESGETENRWLTFPYLFRPYPTEADTIRATSLLQRRQTRQFIRPHGYHQLSATASRDALFGTEAVHGLLPGATHPRLAGAGFVVEAGMDDAAVVSRLMLGEPVLGLEHNRQVPPFRKRESGGNPYNSAAHYDRPIWR
jgi:hypothetical protein